MKLSYTSKRVGMDSITYLQNDKSIKISESNDVRRKTQSSGMQHSTITINETDNATTSDCLHREKGVDSTKRIANILVFVKMVACWIFVGKSPHCFRVFFLPPFTVIRPFLS